MNQLEIPDRALRAGQRAWDDVTSPTGPAPLEAAAAAMAPILVAEALRRLDTECAADGCDHAGWLTRQADELDPEGATT